MNWLTFKNLIRPVLLKGGAALATAAAAAVTDYITSGHQLTEAGAVKAIISGILAHVFVTMNPTPQSK